ncbi:GNAT family N-acetyltransferase [Azospirillum sp. A39]|uniref:GNAT family N-acetyltransferase n=1 Tax=Azospirillum sp. A39 TaxID=3462279 RepID=UPI004045AF98
MVQVFETLRLHAARPHPDDLDDLARMHTDAAVMATLGGKVWTVPDTAAFLDRLMRHWDRHGYGVWILRDRTDGAFVGRAGLRRMPIDGSDETELLYACMPERWSRGYTSEAVAAIVRLAFERLRLRDLVAFTLPGNAASRRVMEKAGFAFERDFIHAGLPHVLYRLRRPADD